jgi:uncharacterized repeat protein (TIGR03803 family)
MNVGPSSLYRRLLVVSLVPLALAAGPLGAADCAFQVLESLDAAAEPDSSGSNPSGGLSLGADGALYGVAETGGSEGAGTIFKVTLPGVETPVRSFETLHDFAAAEGGNPDTALVQGPDGTFYGTTRGGMNGTIFALAEDGEGGHTFITLHTFADADGAHPGRLLLGADGRLYGATNTQGAAGMGTVFRMNTDGSDFTVLHDFSGPDGANPAPSHSLVQGTDGTLYGTTFNGGSHDAGTVFRMQADGTEFATVWEFGATSEAGSHPTGVTLGQDGSLYGVTREGGSAGAGTVFRLSPDGSGGFDATELHGFEDAGQGENPLSLIVGANGALHGTTEGGGAHGAGTIFRVDADGSDFTVLQDLGADLTDGQRTSSLLVQGPDGALYGTTYEGGDDGAGTLFRLALQRSTWISTSSSQALGGTRGRPGDVFLFQQDCTVDDASPQVELFARMRGLDIEGVDVQANGDVVFSVRQMGLVQQRGGHLLVKPDNLYVLDPGSGEIDTLVNWKDHGIDITGANVDAVDLQQDGTIAFSVGTLRGVTHAGGYTVLRPQNVYRFDPESSTISLMFDGVAAGIPDIDGIDVDPDGRIAFSTKSSVFVNGTYLRHQNAYTLDEDGEASLALEGEALGLTTLDDFTLDLPMN